MKFKFGPVEYFSIQPMGSNFCSTYNTVHLYLYISKSWNVTFIVDTLQLNHISVHVIIFFIFNFPIIFLTLLIHFFFSFFKYLHSQTFLLPLPLHLLTTLYFNIILPLSLYFPLFCLFLFSHSYYKFVIFSFILCIVSLHKKSFLSLSLSIFW